MPALVKPNRLKSPDDGQATATVRCSPEPQTSCPSLQAARRDPTPPATPAKLDAFDCLILDDLGHVREHHAETSVLFELIAERCERRSLIIACNRPFGE